MEHKKVEKVKFSVTWQVYGYKILDLPDHLKGAPDDTIKKWICDNWKDIPLPEVDEYLEDSDEPDFDYFERWEEDE